MKSAPNFARFALLAIPLLTACCAHRPAPPPPEAVVDSDERTPEDRALDAGRKPEELLAFIDLKPGMRVAELVAGGGYTTELLARAVGPQGAVYGQNPKWLLEKFAEKPWAARLSRPVNRNVVRLDRELNEPFPAEVSGLDRVVSNLVYHDAVWQGVDRPRMNSAVFQVLRPGGRYIVCDSSAKPGSGPEVTQTLHRIDEEVVRREVTAAGFTLEEEGSFLRNPADTRDWNASPMAAGKRRGTSDRFCLRFEKP